MNEPRNTGFRLTSPYDVYSIDGHALPVPDAVAAGAYVTAGKLSPVSSDTVLVERTVVGNGVSIVQRGTMVVHANYPSLVLVPESGLPDSGEVHGDTVAINEHVATPTGGVLQRIVYIRE